MAPWGVLPYDVVSMKLYTHPRRVLFVCALAFLGAMARSAVAAGVPSQAETVATIRQLETRWTQAEATGDHAFLENLLMANYRSVSVSGKVRDKADIIAGAMRWKSPAMRHMIESYMEVHHVATSVNVQGNTAIVTFYSQLRGEKSGISSCDIFVNVNGQWRALYSQHSSFME
jgi:ketosteroid isomerase-like protein